MLDEPADGASGVVEWRTSATTASEADTRRRARRFDAASAAALPARPGRSLCLVTEVLLLLALVAAPWAYGGAPDPARYALCAWVLFALVPWAAALARRGSAWPAFVTRAWALPALAVVQAAVGLSAAPFASLDAALVMLACLGAAAFWSERTRTRHAAAQRLAAAVLAVALAQGLFGAVQRSWSPERIYGATATLVTMPFGSYVNHNHFAGLAGMAALLAVGLAWGHARRAGEPTPASIGLAGLALGLAATLLASRSRGGLVALAAGLVALVALRGLEAALRQEQATARRLVFGAGTALLAGGLGALALVPPETRAHLLGTFTGEAADDGSSAYRLDMARATLRLALHHPLAGAGFGAFPDAVTAYKTTHGELRATHAESDVLEVLSEGGLLGLGGIALLATFVARRLRERLLHGRDLLHTGLVSGAAAALVGLGVHSLFDFNLRLPANALVAASLLGLVASGRARGVDEAPATPAPRRPSAWAWVIVLLLALLAGLAAWRAAGAFQLQRALELPAPQRLGALDTVIRVSPFLAEAWHARGLAWRDAARTQREARLARSERDLTTALRLRPAWGAAWADRGWLRLARADARGARADLDRAVLLDPTHIGIGAARAEVYARTGDPGEGARQLARTLAANPGWGAPAAIEMGLRWATTEDVLSPLAGSDPGRRQLVRDAFARRGPAPAPPAAPNAGEIDSPRTP